FSHRALTSIFNLSLHDALPIYSFHSDKISFIELISFPTTGMAKKFNNVYTSHLFSEANLNHLIQLDQLLSSQDKIIFIAWGLLRSEEHTSELQSRENIVCRLLL